MMSEEESTAFVFHGRRMPARVVVDLLLVRFLDFLFFAALAGARWLSAKTCNFDRWCIEFFEYAYLSVLQI